MMIFFGAYYFHDNSLHKKTQKVVFFGDSITEQGAKPGGYIMRMKDALTQKGVASQYDLVGRGRRVAIRSTTCTCGWTTMCSQRTPMSCSSISA